MPEFFASCECLKSDPVESGKEPIDKTVLRLADDKGQSPIRKKSSNRVQMIEGEQMRNLRTYDSSTITDFLHRSTAEILGTIHSNDSSAETTIQQSNTWARKVEILKDQLRGLDGRVIFEYIIPRMGKRVDVVVLHKRVSLNSHTASRSF